jgi:hypothetical protein
MSGRMEKYWARSYKLEFLQKYPFTFYQDRMLKKYQLVKPYKYRYQLDKTGKCQTKSMTPMWTFGSQMGQEFMTALFQVFIDPYIITWKAHI